jgi:hypothetical protein
VGLGGEVVERKGEEMSMSSDVFKEEEDGNESE